MLTGWQLPASPLHRIEHLPCLEPGFLELGRGGQDGDSHPLAIDVLQDDEPDLVALAQLVSALFSVAGRYLEERQARLIVAVTAMALVVGVYAVVSPGAILLRHSGEDHVKSPALRAPNRHLLR